MKNRFRRNIPGINSSASADLSFLLLIFFIITISIDPSWIMPMHLSPAMPKNQKTSHIVIKERNFLPVFIDNENRIFCRSTEIKAGELRVYTKHFIENSENNENLPEKITVNIPSIGDASITQNHIIALSNEEKTSFQAYVFVQNEIIAAYNELREELSLKTFGKSYKALSLTEQNAVKIYYPRKISRPERTSKGGRP